MPFDLKAVLDSLDDLPETVAITDLYSAGEDGKYRLPPKIDGFKSITDFDALQEALRKERNDHKAIREKIKPLGDRDIVEMLDQIGQLDELKEQLEAANAAGEGNKIDDEKLEGMVEKRMARKLQPIERELGAVKTERDSLLETLAGLRSELSNYMISTIVGSLASKNCHPDAVDDVKMAASMHLVRDDTGDILTRDDIPEILPGLKPDQWLTEMLDRRPLWNKPSGNGGGGKGGTSATGIGKNPFTNEGWDTQAQGVIARDKGIEEFERQARAAGVDPNMPRRPSAIRQAG